MFPSAKQYLIHLWSSTLLRYCCIPNTISIQRKSGFLSKSPLPDVRPSGVIAFTPAIVTDTDSPRKRFFLHKGLQLIATMYSTPGMSYI